MIAGHDGAGPRSGFRSAFSGSGTILRGPATANPFCGKTGFTLVELVATLAIVGILAVVLLPRFFDRGTFEQRRFYDEVAAAYRYAGKFAVATGCDVQVRVAGNGYGLYQHAVDCTSGVFTLPVPHPAEGGGFAAVAPGGVTLSAAPATLTFDARGRADNDASITVGGRSFAVVAETGFVDIP